MFFIADIDCGKVPSMLYGNVEYVNSSTYLGSQITYNCVKNYRLNGVVKRVCTESKQWSDSTPKCEGKVLLYTFQNALVKHFLYRNSLSWTDIGRT